MYFKSYPQLGRLTGEVTASEDLTTVSKDTTVVVPQHSGNVLQSAFSDVPILKSELKAPRGTKAMRTIKEMWPGWFSWTPYFQ